MSQRRVVITVDRTKVPQVEDLLEQLKAQGLSVDEMDTLFDVTHIVGRYDGDVGRLKRDGVACEPEGWKDELTE